MNDVPETPSAATGFAHASFLANPDLAAEREIWREVTDDLARRFDAAQLLQPGAALASELRALVDGKIAALRRKAAMRGTRGLLDPAGVSQRVLDRLVGLGFLAPLLALPDVEEVSTNGSRVFVTTSDGRKRLVEHLAPDEDETLQLIKRAIGPLGGRLDESQPVVECSLPDGSRLTAVIPPMSNTVQLSIRRFVLRALTLETLVTLGTLPEETARFLEAAVRAGVNMLIAGPTAAGKTTFINALGAAIPSTKKVVSLEDTPELRLGLPDHVPLYARIGNVEGVGAITYRNLMRTALRLRPDYLLVGEVRGAEAIDMLASMATGHASFGTIHARSPRGALKQLATFAAMAEEHPSREAVADLVAGTVELVVYLHADSRTQRRQVTHVLEVTGLGESATVEGHDLWTMAPTADGSRSLEWSGIRPRCLEKIAERGVTYEPPPLALDRVRVPRVATNGQVEVRR
jgi:pilus assembly protein CpaF